jgi:hypothetical protein
MVRMNSKRWRVYSLACCVTMLLGAGVSRAGDNDKELRALIEEQNRQIQELKRRLDSAGTAPVTANADPANPNIDESAVKKIVSDYLKENPGAGMPASVQTGYSPSSGFFIRSAPDPAYVKWDDQSKIPFEIRFRGRVQLDYYNYKVTDRLNHQTGLYVGQNSNEPFRQADFSQLEIKRLRLSWSGTAFDPNLRYFVELDGNTRGLGGTQNNKVTPGSGNEPNTSAASPIGGGLTVDHSVRLFQAWLAYDFHGCNAEKGCGLDCPEGTTLYAPTYTIIAGKLKPYFAFEEYIGSANQQMVEYGMTEWFFDADDDNLLMAAGTQIKAMEDRLFVSALITNGSESQFPNTQMDNLPGFNFGFWYDFGGSWNSERNRWDLFGDSIADVDYSCSPVARFGAMANIVPLGRRSLYGDLEQSRYRVTPGGPQGGTPLINILSGGNAMANPAGLVGTHSVDQFDAYTYETYIAAKYKGFSFLNDWFFRNLNNFRTTPNGRGDILYTDSTGNNALFPRSHGLFDFGTMVQGGYFIVPKTWEIVARFSWIRGDSGDLNGSYAFHTTTVPNVTGPVKVINDAFRNFHEAREWGFGVNRYWKRQMLKWQTDFSFYEGGNPAGNGQSPAGFIAGSDGWLLRTQLQLAF